MKCRVYEHYGHRGQILTRALLKTLTRYDRNKYITHKYVYDPKVFLLNTK